MGNANYAAISLTVASQRAGLALIVPSRRRAIYLISTKAKFFLTYPTASPADRCVLNNDRHDTMRY
jgi:hypothetical protein